MDFIIWLILVVLAILLFSFNDYLSKPVVKNIFTNVMLIIVLAVIFSPIYYEFPTLLGSNIYIKNEQGIYEYKPYGGFCYEWGDNYKILPDNIFVTYDLETKKIYLWSSNHINHINRSVQLQIFAEVFDVNKLIKENISKKIRIEINKYCQTNDSIITAQMEFLLQSDNKNYQSDYKKIIKLWNKYFIQKNIKITSIHTKILINY